MDAFAQSLFELAALLGGQRLPVEHRLQIGDLPVSCRRRPDDDDRAWFYVGDEPVADAERPVDAITAIKGRLGEEALW